MSELVYKIIELCGTSKTDMEGAVQNAVSRAAESVRGLKWFKVTETLGVLDQDRIVEWQVMIKVGFDIETGSQPAKETGEKGEERTAEKKKGEKKEEEKRPQSKGLYRCEVCGYVYDPQKGDPTQDIKPGTAFDDLPDSWKCPECGVGKDRFKKMG